jgi:hypothetical protein
MNSESGKGGKLCCPRYRAYGSSTSILKEQPSWASRKLLRTEIASFSAANEVETLPHYREQNAIRKYLSSAHHHCRHVLVDGGTFLLRRRQDSRVSHESSSSIRQGGRPRRVSVTTSDHTSERIFCSEARPKLLAILLLKMRGVQRRPSRDRLLI